MTTETALKPDCAEVAPDLWRRWGLDFGVVMDSHGERVAKTSGATRLARANAALRIIEDHNTILRIGGDPATVGELVAACRAALAFLSDMRPPSGSDIYVKHGVVLPPIRAVLAKLPKETP